MRISKIMCIFVSVNQQVDIEKYLEEFRAEIGQLNKTVKDLSDDNARLYRRVEAQNVEIQSLKSENNDLRGRLSKYEDPQPPKNSGNSSVPPSKESMGDEIRRRTSSLREKSGRNPGGQPGHEGNTRKMSEQPDETENIQPNYCRECGRELSDIEGVEEYREECVGVRIIPVVKSKKTSFSQEDLYLRVLQPCGIYSAKKSGISVFRDKGACGLSQYSDVHAIQPHQKFSS